VEIDAFLHGQTVSDATYASIVRTYDNTMHKRELPFVP
jgi:NAD+ synthase